MSVVDDHGRFHALPKLLRAACYPLQIDKVSDPDIGKWTTACVAAGLVRVYPASDGKRYIEILKFGQQVRSKSKFPDAVVGACEQSLATDSNCNHPPADAHLGVSVSVSVSEDVSEDVSEGVTPARKRATPPPDRPESVAEQTWDDWTRLRKEKRASVSETVLAEAVTQAQKAGVSLDRFLRSWCGSGWQGYTAKQFRERETATGGNAHNGGYAAERNRAFGGDIGDNAHDIFDEEKHHDIALPHARR